MAFAVVSYQLVTFDGSGTLMPRWKKNLVDALPTYAIVKIWISMFKFARAALWSLSGLRGVCLQMRLFQIRC